MLELGERGTAWVGPNASGKTSILEAIQKLTILRGFGKEEEMMRWGSSGYRLRARLSEGIVEVTYEKGKGTRVYWEGEVVQPLSRWIGRFPVVSLRPADITWIEGGAMERRRWADRLLSQLSPPYLEALTRYQRALDQRNALLQANETSLTLLEPWENILISEGVRIQQMRQELAGALAPIIAEYYALFGGERPHLIYKSSVEPDRQSWLSAWERQRKEELRLGRTLIGPHLEDFILRLDGQVARGYASEGQKKSLLIALKWAEVAHLRAKGRQPILLLDDVGEKLDKHRLSALGRLSRLAAQTFLTDTDLSRVQETFPELSVIQTPLG